MGSPNPENLEQQTEMKKLFDEAVGGIDATYKTDASVLPENVKAALDKVFESNPEELVKLLMFAIITGRRTLRLASLAFTGRKRRYYYLAQDWLRVIQVTGVQPEKYERFEARKALKVLDEKRTEIATETEKRKQTLDASSDDLLGMHQTLKTQKAPQPIDPNTGRNLRNWVELKGDFLPYEQRKPNNAQETRKEVQNTVAGVEGFDAPQAPAPELAVPPAEPPAEETSTENPQGYPHLMEHTTHPATEMHDEELTMGALIDYISKLPMDEEEKKPFVSRATDTGLPNAYETLQDVKNDVDLVVQHIMKNHEK